MVEIVKWAGIFFLAILVYGAFRSKPPTTPLDLPDNWLFWVGFYGCIVCLVVLNVYSIRL